MKVAWLGKGRWMKKRQIWTRRSLSDEKKDDMTISSTLWFVEGK